jgi:hypothetical protein
LRCLLRSSTRPFGQGRTALLYGEWLQQERRKCHARSRLTMAAQLFDRYRFGAVG